MTPAYERASDQTNAVRRDSGCGGEVSRGKAHGVSKKCHLFSAADLSEKTHLHLLCQQTFGDVDLTFKIEFI